MSMQNLTWHEVTWGPFFSVFQLLAKLQTVISDKIFEGHDNRLQPNGVNIPRYGCATFRAFS